MQCQIYSIRVSDVRKKWFGDSENRIKILFEMARSSDCGAIIFIDEVDSLCKIRGSDDSDSLSNDILSELLTQAQGFGTEEMNRGVLLVGATNLPMKMDSAMLR